MINIEHLRGIFMNRQKVAELDFGHIIFGKKGSVESLFLVLGNNGEKAFCLESCIGEKMQEKDVFVVEILGRTLFFDTRKKVALSRKNIIKRETFLTSEQKRTLQSLLPKEAKKSNVPKRGDIILYLNQTFIIETCKADCYDCYICDVNNRVVGIPFQIYNKDQVEKVGSSPELLQIVFLKQEKARNLGIGTLVSKKGYIYYIYDKEETFYRAVRVDFKEGKQLKINRISYSTSLSEKIHIPKNSQKYKVLMTSTEEEIQNNKPLFPQRKIKIEQKKSPLESTSALLLEGDIIKSESGSVYFFIMKKEKCVICLDSDKYLNGEMVVKDFQKESFYIIGNLGQNTYREILRTLSQCYSSYFTRGEIQLLLAKKIEEEEDFC